MQPPRNGRPWPRIWLMTDQRNDHAVEAVAQHLPRGCGIIFRHYHLEEEKRAQRFARLRKIARRRGHQIFLAGPPPLARAWKADGVHGREWKRHQTSGLLQSAPVHDAREIALTKRNGADIFFLSPAFATRSHPSQKPHNASQLRQLIRLCSGPVILLGGMNEKRFAQCKRLGAYGWAAIDAHGV